MPRRSSSTATLGDETGGRLAGQLTLPAAAAISIGLIDAALIALGLGGARGSFEFVPARLWIVAPLTWMAVGAGFGVAFLPFTRSKLGLLVATALAVTFIGIRLRTHPTLLIGALAVLAVLLGVVSRWVLRGTVAPRRSATVTIFASAGVSALLLIAPPSLARPGPPASGAPGPNVILIFLDTVRYDALFDTSGRVHSDLPALARLQSESTTFTRAYATSPWTLPSHLSVMTGLPADQLDVGFDDQVYSRDDATLAERFRGEGYRTAAVISNSFLNAGSGFARGFDTFHHADSALDLCRTAPGLVAERYWPWFAAGVCNWTGSAVTRRALEVLDDKAAPVFLALNYMDAHDPYYVERSCGAGRGYRAAIVCLDRNLAPVLDWRSPRRPTMLVVVGDHGEQFGEHGLERHGNSLYVQLLHVPLVIRTGAPVNVGMNATPVSIAEVPSLVGAIDTTSDGDRPVTALLHPPAAANLPSEWSALDGSWHLIVRERGSDALYYLPTDPAEEHNIISSQPSDPAIERLRAAIAEMRRSPRPDLGKFRSLGYIH